MKPSRLAPMSLLLALGCPRPAAPGAAPATTTMKATGSRCAGAGECASGLCAEGVCCETTCLEREWCAAPGREGACTRRERGDPCRAAAQCPDDACADGVCCDTPCADACQTCNVEGEAGHCRLAPDNTDARHDCDGDCQACFRGTCLPALSATNPKMACSDGEACDGTGGCALSNGASCDEGGGDGPRCASGWCLANQCASVVVTRQPLLGIPAAHDQLFLMDLDVDRADRPVALLWSDRRVGGNGEDNQAHVARWSPSGWTLQRLPACLAFYDWVSMVTLGDWVYVAHSHLPMTGVCNGERANDPARVTGRLLGPGGEVGAEEVPFGYLPGGDEKPVSLAWMGMQVLPDGSVHLLGAQDDAGGSTLHVLRRVPSPTVTWEVEQSLPGSGGMGMLARAGHDTIVVDNLPDPPGGFRATVLGGDVGTATTVPEPATGCDVVLGFNITAVGDDDVVLGFHCRQGPVSMGLHPQPGTARLRRQAGGGWSWTPPDYWPMSDVVGTTVMSVGTWPLPDQGDLEVMAYLDQRLGPGVAWRSAAGTPRQARLEYWLPTGSYFSSLRVSLRSPESVHVGWVVDTADGPGLGVSTIRR